MPVRPRAVASGYPSCPLPVFVFNWEEASYAHIHARTLLVGGHPALSVFYVLLKECDARANARAP